MQVQKHNMLNDTSVPGTYLKTSYDDPLDLPDDGLIGRTTFETARLIKPACSDPSNRAAGGTEDRKEYLHHWGSLTVNLEPTRMDLRA
jgi:hypothetical protein